MKNLLFFIFFFIFSTNVFCQNELVRSIRISHNGEIDKPIYDLVINQGSKDELVFNKLEFLGFWSTEVDCNTFNYLLGFNGCFVDYSHTVKESNIGNFGVFDVYYKYDSGEKKVFSFGDWQESQKYFRSLADGLENNKGNESVIKALNNLLGRVSN